MTAEERLAKIKKLVDAATSGPWTVRKTGDREYTGYSIEVHDAWDGIAYLDGLSRQVKSDANFIATMRNELLWLLDLVAELQSAFDIEEQDATHYCEVATDYQKEIIKLRQRVKELEDQEQIPGLREAVLLLADDADREEGL